MKKAILFGIYFMIEFLTVSSVNADNRKRDVFPGSRGQCVRGAQAHGPWGHYFYSNTLCKGTEINYFG